MYPIIHCSRVKHRWLKCLFPLWLASLLLFMLCWLMYPHSAALGASPTAVDCTQVQVTKIPEKECQALVDLYNSTSGVHWVAKAQAHWLEDNTPCTTWLGVTCNSGTVPQHIISLKLNGQGSSYGFGVTGTLPSSLIDLTELITLSIPGEPFHLLGDLDTVSRKLHGSLPNLQSLHNLQAIYLPWNDFTDELSSLGNLPKLQGLVLDSNPVSGDLGSLLGLLNRDQLTQLSLNGTNISGSIPPELGLFHKLTHIYLGSCNLNGEIPSELGQLTNLTRLLIHGCQPLTGSLTWITQMHQLRYLYIENVDLRDGIPSAIDNLGDNLTELTIKNGNLSGSIPLQLSKLKNLQTLDLSGNRLEGGIPPEFGGLTKLQHLLLANNALEGPVPSLPPGLVGPDLRYNKLICAGEVGCSPETQTVPPTMQQASVIPPNNAILTWQPIQYQGNNGGYEISYGTKPGGPYTKTVSISDKRVSTYNINNLCPGQTYYFAARTHTPPHVTDTGQQNDLLSLYSNQVSAPMPSYSIRLLSLHALALDSNLDKQYDSIVQGIAATTAQNTEKVAVMLVDRQGLTNTHILVAHCGQITQLEEGLPDPSNEQLPAVVQTIPQLNPAIQEYNMTDPASISAFIRWARATCGGLPDMTCSQPKTVLSYIGHGMPLAPATDISHLIQPPRLTVTAAQQAALSIYLPPAPTKIEATPDQLTDQTSLSLISPYSLTLALRMATNEGAAPITVLDIVHCFGSTIEELYELTNPITNELTSPIPNHKPVAEAMVGSPSYTYLGWPILSDVMLNVNPDQSASQMAASIVQAYETALAEADTFDDKPGVKHPRIIVAVDSGKVRAIKDAVDILASDLITTSNQNAVTTTNVLSATQRISVHYDTTTCDEHRKPDFALTAEDGLSDLYDFAQRLHDQQDITQAAKADTERLMSQVNSAVITVTKASGSPWFAYNPEITYNFSRAQGIAIYADLQGFTIDNQRYLGWQAHWYTSTVSPENPHPYAFVQGNTTWANVLLRYWADQFGSSNDLKTIGCSAILPTMRLREVYLPVVLK